MQKRTGVTLLLVLLLVGVAPLRTTPANAQPGAGGRIAYVHEQAVWIVNEDGSGREQLTGSVVPRQEVAPWYYQSPQWSPDGTKLAAPGPTDAPLLLQLRDRTVITMTQADDRRLLLSMSWSPDSEKMVFEAAGDLDVPSDIRIWDPQRQTVRVIADGRFPSWSPVDDAIAFLTHAAVCLTGFGGSQTRCIFSEERLSPPHWSPDGQQIAFAHAIPVPELGDIPQLEIIIVDREGRVLRSIEIGVVGSVWDFRLEEWEGILWSPSGDRIAFAMYDEPGAELFIVDSDGTNMRSIVQLGIGEEIESMAWSPDGKKLAVCRKRTKSGVAYGEILVLNADGTNLRKVADGWSPAWQPGLETAEAPPPPSPGTWVNHGDGNTVWGLAIAQGSLWAATAGGVVRWDLRGGSYTRHSDGPPGACYYLAVDAEGGLWATCARLGRFDGYQWSTYDGLRRAVEEHYAAMLGAAGFDSIWVSDPRTDTIWIHSPLCFPEGVEAYNGEVWRTVRHLPEDGKRCVWSIAVDLEGTKWMVASDDPLFPDVDTSLTRFDGSQWITYLSHDTPDEPFAMVKEVMVDKKGALWFCLYWGDVARWYKREWKIWDANLHLGGHDAAALLGTDEDDRLWLVLDRGGVGVLDDATNTWTVYTKENSGICRYVTAMAVDGEGRKYFGCVPSTSNTEREPGGISVFDEGANTWATYSTDDAPFGWYGGLSVHDIAVDDQGNKWIAAGKVLRFDGTEWVIYSASSSGLVDDSATAIAVDDQGHKWIATSAGVNLLSGEQWSAFSTANSGLVSDNVVSIAVEDNGSVWFGTSGGVSTFDGSTWTTYTTDNSGLADGSVVGIAIDAHSNKWFGTSSGYVSRLTGSDWQTFGPADALESSPVTALAADGAGGVWVARRHAGVSWFDGADWVTYSEDDALPDDTVESIAVDSTNIVWLGMNSKVSRFDGSTWTHYSAYDGLLMGMIEAIAIEGGGSKWFGSNEGLSEFREGQELQGVDEIVLAEESEPVLGGREQVTIPDPQPQPMPSPVRSSSVIPIFAKGGAVLLGFALIVASLLIYRRERPHE